MGGAVAAGTSGYGDGRTSGGMCTQSRRGVWRRGGGGGPSVGQCRRVFQVGGPSEESFSFLFVFLKKFIYLFIYFWLCWVLVSVRGLSLVAASGGHSSLRCVGLSLSRPLLPRGTGSRRAGSVIVAHGPSCSAACGIFPDQGSNRCPLHWQADSQPLRHQRSPRGVF